MDITTLIDRLIEREGGYSNHPADRGGPTNYGITVRIARRCGYEGSMRDLPRDLAVRIYRELYWELPGFDDLAPVAPRIAAELFDTGVNMGPGTAVEFLHRALNALNRNGRDYADLPHGTIITDRTVAALRAFIARRKAAGETVLLKAVEALQGERYIDLAERRAANEAFVYGWLANRVG